MISNQYSIAATHLQNLIAANASEAQQWTCCFLDRKDELVLGIKPGSDIEEQRQIASTVVGEIEITVVEKTFMRHANKQALNRPVIGGIQIRQPGLNAVGTAGVVVEINGAIGVITAGHVVGAINNSVYQPMQSNRNNWEIGIVTHISDYTGNALSDSAFVQLNDEGEPFQIWKNAKSRYIVTGTGTAQVGGAVLMQGASIKTLERPGVICSTNATVRFSDGGVLSDQYLATYLTRNGDSGAPVYIKNMDPNVTLIGINVGGTEFQYIEEGAPDQNTYPPNKDGMYAVISKWDNILGDLF